MVFIVFYLVLIGADKALPPVTCPICKVAVPSPVEHCAYDEKAVEGVGEHSMAARGNKIQPRMGSASTKKAFQEKMRALTE